MPVVRLTDGQINTSLMEKMSRIILHPWLIRPWIWGIPPMVFDDFSTYESEIFMQAFPVSLASEGREVRTVVDEKRRDLLHDRGQGLAHADITTAQFTNAVAISFRT